MAMYQKKYTLEFDDIIQGEFNDYKLEIFKKYEIDTLDTSNNVYVSAYNAAQGLLYKGTPVYIQSGIIYRSKANDPTSMPAQGVIYADMPQSSGGNVLISGMMDYGTSYGDQDVWVGSTGGLVLTEPTSGVVQKIGYKSGTGSGSFLVLLDNLVTLKGNNSPIQLTYNSTQDDLLSPFRSSYLDISFYKESLSDDYTELFAAEDDAFKVYLLKNNELFWRGWIGSQLFSEPFQSPPYLINLRAYDGLHLLKNKLYFDNIDVFQAQSNTLNDRYGYHNITDIVEKCIYNTGVIGDSIYLDSDLYYYINITNGSNFASQFTYRTRIHHQTFLKGESNSMNMEEVLKIILEALGCIIYQRDGDWCIMRISDLTLNASSNCVKRSNWRYDSSTLINYVTTTTVPQGLTRMTKNTNFLKVEGKGSFTMQYPLKEVIIEQEFDHNMITKTTIDSVRDLGASDPSGIYLFDEWEPSGANVQEAVVLRSQQVLSEQTDIAKSFIEVDLNPSGVVMDYCDSHLYYPQSHDCKIDSSHIKGLKAFAKIRPIGRNLVQKEAADIMFSPKLKYAVSGSIKEYGFGRSEYYQSSMIDKRILRMNLEGMPPVNGGTGRPDGQTLKKNLLILTFAPNQAGSGNEKFNVKVYQNGLFYWESGTVQHNGTIVSNFIFGGGYDSGSVNFFDPNNKFMMFEEDYTVVYEKVLGNPIPIRFEWYIQGNNEADNYEVSWVSMPDALPQVEATTNNFKFAVVQPYPYTQTQEFRDGGNFGTTKASVGRFNLSSNMFRKEFNCSDNNYLPIAVKTNEINNWKEYTITGFENWNSSIANLTISMHIFGAAKVVDVNEDNISSPYSDTYDVSYTDMKLLPLVTSNRFTPKKQEYKLTQLGNFSNKKNKKTKLGSGLFNTGSNRFIGFTTTSGTGSQHSWDDWSDTKITNSTMQHLLASCYMELYRVSVRRLDGMHYGNYTYGNTLLLRVNNTTETFNGSQGRFFPMGVKMDLKMARTTFTGDDLLDNSGTNWLNGLTKTIKWIGDNDITETETLT